MGWRERVREEGVGERKGVLYGAGGVYSLMIYCHILANFLCIR